MKNFLIALLSLSSLVAYAGDVITAPLLDGVSDPYQKLMSEFNSAGPAQMSDYPLISALDRYSPPYSCVAITGPILSGVQPVPTLTKAYIGRVNITISGTPNDGPLFPGTSSQTVIKMMTVWSGDASFSGWHNAQWAAYVTTGDHAGQLSTEVSSSGDLQTVANFNAEPGVTRTDTYRKKSSLLFFHEVVTGVASGDVAGYCYPAN